MRQSSKIGVDRKNAIPLYQQIADRLAREITEGNYKPFDRLPTEHELMARLDVSRVTVRQAIAKLAQMGLIVTRQGMGSFVAGPVVQHELEDLKGFYDTLTSQGHQPDTDLLEFGAARAPRDIELLLDATGQKAVYLKRLYSLQGRPFALVRAWLPAAAQRVSWDEAVRHPLYAILQNLLGFRVVRADVSIAAKLADEEESRLLGLEPGSPVMVMERTSESKDGKVLEISNFCVRPESYRFRLSVQGPLAITSQIQQSTTTAVVTDRPNPGAGKRARKPQEKNP